MSSQETIMDAFRTILRPLVREVLDEATDSTSSKENKTTRVYTRKEVCERLRIGTTTFYRLAIALLVAYYLITHILKPKFLTL
jgi:hypothetical protein